MVTRIISLLGLEKPTYIVMGKPKKFFKICNPFTGFLKEAGPGLAKSLDRHPGAIVFSNRATKIYHRPARLAGNSRGWAQNGNKTQRHLQSHTGVLCKLLHMDV